MTDEEFNKRCLENYHEYTCKDCKHYVSIGNNHYGCKQFPTDTSLLEVDEDFTCKLWEANND